LGENASADNLFHSVFIASRVTPAATNAELLAAALPHARLVMLAGCGHLPEVEFPSRVNDLIAARLS
jgi:pimeloyl-ACP methyl ester carboxylesterase